MRRTASLASLAVAATTALALPLTAPASATDLASATDPAGADSTAARTVDGAVDAALDALAAHPRAARAAAGQDFEARGVHVDDDGSTHVRLDRTWRGLRVLGGDLVVHRSPTGRWEGVSQTLDRRLSVATTPVLGKDAAERAALAPNPANRSVSGDRTARRTDLVVDASGATPRLAWEVVTGGVQEDGTPSELMTYVDARSGAVLRTVQGIQTVEGEGRTLYSGDVPLQLAQSGSAYELKDPTRGGTFTTDMGNRSDSMVCQIFGTCPDGELFTSPDTTFGDGTTGNRESAAADAQYGTNVTWDYFSDVHGRDGIFGDGSGSFNRVHYGQDYVNAFWDGEKMTYGDGDGVDFGPLTSLDVAGHEMTHGVTENTANLTYSGESGGLNESTSDIYGTMVEFHAANADDPGDYLIGEEFDLKQHRGFRRMDQPSADGSSYDCWSAAVGTADVHYSSGVGNHFFYLLAEGSGAKTFGGVAHESTTCDGSTVTGIGRAAAADIWFRALTVYMTSSTDYAGARSATLAAAEDLHGAGSAERAAVAAAWSAVNVG